MCNNHRRQRPNIHPNPPHTTAKEMIQMMLLATQEIAENNGIEDIGEALETWGWEYIQPEWLNKEANENE